MAATTWNTAFAPIRNPSQPTISVAEKPERKKYSIATAMRVMTSAVIFTRQNIPDVIPRETCELNHSTNQGDSSQKWKTKMTGAIKTVRVSVSFVEELFTCCIADQPMSDTLQFVVLLRRLSNKLKHIGHAVSFA
jgi:hypothetical protein